MHKMKWVVVLALSGLGCATAGGLGNGWTEYGRWSRPPPAVARGEGALGPGLRSAATTVPEDDGRAPAEVRSRGTPDSAHRSSIHDQDVEPRCPPTSSYSPHHDGHRGP